MLYTHSRILVSGIRFLFCKNTVEISEFAFAGSTRAKGIVKSYRYFRNYSGNLPNDTVPVGKSKCTYSIVTIIILLLQVK